MVAVVDIPVESIAGLKVVPHPVKGHEESTQVEFYGNAAFPNMKQVVVIPQGFHAPNHLANENVVTYRIPPTATIERIVVESDEFKGCLLVKAKIWYKTTNGLRYHSHTLVD